MRSREEIIRKIADLRISIRVGKELRFPTSNLEAFANVLGWVLEEVPET